MNNKLTFIFLIVSISLLLSACGGKEGASIDSEGIVEAEAATGEIENIEINTESSNVERSTSKEVVIENGRFNPVDIKVNLGDTVEWVNLDMKDNEEVEHSITFEDARFDVKIPYGASVTYTFVETGEARYFSHINPDARGSVLVE